VPPIPTDLCEDPAAFGLLSGRLCASAIMAARMKPDYSRIPRHTLKTLEAWIATGRHLDDDDEADAFCLAIVMNDLEA
jgi:hypothetical protein